MENSSISFFAIYIYKTIFDKWMLIFFTHEDIKRWKSSQLPHKENGDKINSKMKPQFMEAKGVVEKASQDLVEESLWK